MKTKCLNCKKEIVRYLRKSGIKELPYPVINPFCSEDCREEFYENLYRMIGYNDGWEDGFDIGATEMILNFVSQMGYDFNLNGLNLDNLCVFQWQEGYEEGYKKALEDNNILYGKDADRFLEKMLRVEKQKLTKKQIKLAKEVKETMDNLQFGR